MAPFLLSYKRRRSDMMKKMVGEQTIALSMQPPPTKRVRTHDDETSNTQAKQCPLECLPPELFCQILSFVGPASMSLLSLAQVNQYFRGTMTTIGVSMLQRAQTHFRVPLVPRSPTESKTSQFIRHARVCSKILCELTHLQSLLRETPTTADAAQVQFAMDLALKLLQVGPSLSVSLERQILSTCGKCGGKAFKYSKWMLSNCAVMDPGKEVGTQFLLERQHAYVKSQSQMDKARFIMQSVVYRDFQLTKQCPTGSIMRPKKETITQMKVSGCF